MPNALDAARQALEEERNALHDRLAKVEHALRVVSRPTAVSPAAADRRVATPAQAGLPSRRAPRGNITDTVLEILQAQGGGAIHGNEVLAQLAMRGVGTTKGSLASTLVRLSRQGQVQNIGRNRWRRARG